MATPVTMSNETASRGLFSIKLVLLAVFGGLLLLILAVLGWRGAAAWTAYTTVIDQKEFDAGANRFIAGLYEVLLERLATNNALQAAEPASPTVIAAIEAHRKVIKDNFDAGLAMIQQRGFPNQRALLESLAASLQKANDYRRQADEAIKRPRDQRDQNLRQTFTPVLTDSVNAALKVWFAALYTTAKADPQLARLASIKEIGWRMRDFSGQERANVATAIASGTAIPPDRLAANATMRSRVDLLWQQLQNLTQDADTHPAIKNAMQAAEQKYFKDFLSLSDEMRKVGEAGAKYPMTPTQWVDTTNPQIGSLLDVLYAARTAGVAAADAAINRALSEMTVVLALIALTIAIAIVCAWVVIARVSTPLTRLSGAMLELANGNFGVILPGLGRKDEIGNIAGAVETFKIKAAENVDREAGEKANAKQLAAEREAAMQRMTHEFETAVGEIVKAAIAGDFNQRVELQGKSGLVLNTGAAINSMCENTAKALDDLVKMLNALAEGDLTERITSSYQGNFARLKDNANMMADRISTTIADIKSAGREVTNASNEISTSTTSLSQRTEEQAASLEQTSASLEEIATTVKQNAENAQLANQSAAETRAVAERGGVVVGEAIKAMSKIEESSRKIADIIGVIDEIARQTNLLALNAAVEAARAGEAGRGFAVVASEVRSLAQRSSQAAKDIKDLITNSSSQVQEGVGLVSRTGSALDEIVASIKKVADVISSMASASAEQAEGLDQVNKAMAQMDEVTQQNSALVEENAATAKALEQQSMIMDERVSFFRLDETAGSGSARPAAAAKTAARTASSRQNGVVGRPMSVVAVR